MRFATLLIAAMLGGNSLSAQQAREQGPVRVSSGVLSAQIIKRVEPVFPHEALAARVNGAVVCRVLIGKDGKVRDATVISGPEMLRKNYLEAIRQWEYRPYLLNGQAVEVDTVITISISMGDPAAHPQPVSSSGATVVISPSSSPVKVPSGIMAGRKILGSDVILPRDAAAESGGVVLHIVISKNGDVQETTPVAGPPMRARAVAAAVATWKYKPFLVEGQPVEVETQVTVNW